MPRSTPSSSPKSSEAPKAPKPPESAGGPPPDPEFYVAIEEALAEPERARRLVIEDRPDMDEGVAHHLLPELAALPHLESLELLYLTVPFPPVIYGLTKLRELTIRGGITATLPDGIAAMAALERLTLGVDGNLKGVKALPADLKDAPSLRAVDATDTSLSHATIAAHVPAGLRELALDVSAGPATFIGSLTGLERLSLRYAEAKHAKLFGRLPALRAVKLDLPRDLDALLLALSEVPTLRELHLRVSDKVMPPEIGRLTQVENLCLDLVDALPEAIGQITGLRLLDLSWTRLRPSAWKKIVKALPHLEVWAPTQRSWSPRRVAVAAADKPLGRWERWFGYRFPSELKSFYGDDAREPDAAKPFESLVAGNRGEAHWDLHLLPFFANCTMLPETTGGGDFFYAHFEPDCAQAEVWMMIHDDGSSVPDQVVARSYEAFAVLANASFGDDELSPSQIEKAIKKVRKDLNLHQWPDLQVDVACTYASGSRFAALIERSQWIIDRLSNRKEQASPVVGDEADFQAFLAAGPERDTPADQLYWLWGAYFAAEHRLPAALEKARQSRSPVVRDAARLASDPTLLRADRKKR